MKSHGLKINKTSVKASNYVFAFHKMQAIMLYTGFMHTYYYTFN